MLGNKGAGKTHLLHSIKHGTDGAWQLLVTPGVYQKDTDFLEYLLFQIIDTLLGGGKQKGTRPLEYVGEELVRRLLAGALAAPDAATSSWSCSRRRAWAAGRASSAWAASQAQERDAVARRQPRPAAPAPFQRRGRSARRCDEAGLEPSRRCDARRRARRRTEPHNTAGLMRRHILQGFAAAAPARRRGRPGQLPDLRLRRTGLPGAAEPAGPGAGALQGADGSVPRACKIPVVVAFDQLEDLLLARRTDDGHRIAEAFFAGIVQAMHQIDGICFLVFAERGLWNRFVPSLDGYIQDRLNNPVHVPGHGTIKALRLEAPPPDLVRRVVEARLRPALERAARRRRAAGDLPVHRRAGRAHRPHRADAARHAAAVPPPVRPRGLRRHECSKTSRERRRESGPPQPTDRTASRCRR